MPDVTPRILVPFTAVNALGRGTAAVLEAHTDAFLRKAVACEPLAAGQQNDRTNEVGPHL
jgi:hypothetical protein